MPPRSVQLARDLQTRISAAAFQRRRCSQLWSSVAGAAPDLRLVCGDAVSLHCHQTVLAAASTQLGRLLAAGSLQAGDGSLRPDPEAVILIPEVGSDLVSKCLSLLYDGIMGVFNPTDTLQKQQVKEVKKIFQNVLQIDLVKMKDLKCQPWMKCQPFRSFDHVKKEDIKEEPKKHDEEKLLKDINDVIEMTSTTAEEEAPSKRRRILSSKEHVKNVTRPQLNAAIDPPSDSKVDEQCSEPEMKTITSDSAPKMQAVDITPLIPLCSVEHSHICVICPEKTEDGRHNKEREISFSNVIRLKEHYSRHFYTEGKISKWFPLDKRNQNEDGSIKDEFGNLFGIKYKCDKKSATKPSEPCWKSKKRGPGFGYKEISLHNSSEHGLFERIIAEDERPEIRNLATIIEQYLSP